MLLNCQGEHQAETISLQDVMGDTGIEYEDTLTIVDSLSFDNSTITGQFCNAMSPIFKVDSSSKFHLFDRYNFNNSEKIILTTDELVNYGEAELHPSTHVFYYTFNDSVQTNNALYNFLDDLSVDASDQIQLNKDVEAVKSPPVYMLIYDTVIVAAEMMCEHQEYDWDPLQDSLSKYYGSNTRYIINLSCGGPLKWE